MGGEPKRLTPGDSFYYAPSYSPDGKLLAVKWGPGGFDFPRHPQIAVVDAETGENRRVLTASLDRNCDPYPDLREPIWDGSSIVFGIEDGGDLHVYRVSPDGGEPELVHGGEIVLSGFDARDGVVARTGSTAPNLSELYVGEKQLTDDRAAVRGRPRARRARALHRDLRGRIGGGRLDCASGRLRGGQALSRPLEHPRRSRSPSTATGSSTRPRSMPAAGTR